MAFNVEMIKDLIRIVSSSDITELAIECEDLSLKIKRDTRVDGVVTVPHSEIVHDSRGQSGGAEVDIGSKKQEDMKVQEDENFITITSPMVGTFYRAPAPDEKPYVEVGDRIKPGDALCIIEAMKLMNEIEAETEGRIIKILVENSAPVEYGQPLFILEKF